MYLFKDFSTNISGNGVDLVQHIYNLSTKGEAAHLIVEDYNNWLINNKNDIPLREFKVHQKYRVVDFTTRVWNTDDQKYWSKYSIGSSLLEKYNIAPLVNYKFEKVNPEGETISKIISGPRLYGYFKKDGLLYKIYQPMIKDLKFIKIQSYIQGSEQLTYSQIGRAHV